MAHADNTPSYRSPSDATPEHRPPRRARMAMVWGVVVAVVVIAPVVWFVLYLVALEPDVRPPVVGPLRPDAQPHGEPGFVSHRPPLPPGDAMTNGCVAVALDEFRGSLTALEACAALARPHPRGAGRGSPLRSSDVRPTQTLDWWIDGERHFATAMGRVTDEELSGPSLLPGWTRAHVLGHVARNADALVNLLTWARTGEKTPMYPSLEARDAGIAEAAALPAPQLRLEVLDATGRLAAAVRELPDDAWSAEVRTNADRAVQAEQVPWMRCREVFVHAVDLATGVTFSDVPDDVQAALLDDVFAMWQRRETLPDVVLFAGDREWGSGSLGVAGPLHAVTAWVTGRSKGEELTADGPLPHLPAWL